MSLDAEFVLALRFSGTTGEARGGATACWPVG